jgi:hypothetical protein
MRVEMDASIHFTRVQLREALLTSA